MMNDNSGLFLVLIIVVVICLFAYTQKENDVQPSDGSFGRDIMAALQLNPPKQQQHNRKVDSCRGIGCGCCKYCIGVDCGCCPLCAEKAKYSMKKY